MSLSRDLLAVAQALLRQHRRRPNQAFLRRAVSSAYYGVFHFLIEQATAEIAGAGPGNALARAFWARKFNHSQMNETCKQIGSQNNWPKSVVENLSPSANAIATPNAEIQRISQTFTTLQQARHSADYDPLKRFTKEGVTQWYESAKEVVTQWQKIPKGSERSFFLYLLFHGPNSKPR